MGKSNKRGSVKSNRRGPPRVKNRDSNEAVGITIEEVIEKIEERLAPLPAYEGRGPVLAPAPVVQMKPKKNKSNKGEGK